MEGKPSLGRWNLTFDANIWIVPSGILFTKQAINDADDWTRPASASEIRENGDREKNGDPKTEKGPHTPQGPWWNPSGQSTAVVEINIWSFFDKLFTHFGSGELDPANHQTWIHFFTPGGFPQLSPILYIYFTKLKEKTSLIGVNKTTLIDCGYKSSIHIGGHSWTNL